MAIGVDGETAQLSAIRELRLHGSYATFAASVLSPKNSTLVARLNIEQSQLSQAIKELVVVLTACGLVETPEKKDVPALKNWHPIQHG